MRLSLVLCLPVFLFSVQAYSADDQTQVFDPTMAPRVLDPTAAAQTSAQSKSKGVLGATKNLISPKTLIVPPKDELSLPKVKNTTPQPDIKKSYFPNLPPSTRCKPEDIVGLWRWANVFEEPEGAETATYNANPIQYVWFGKNNVFGKYNAGQTPMLPKDIRTQIKAHATNFLQYLMQKGGIVYFYQDKVATDAQMCFIVANAKPPFTVGDMLLIPPKGQIQGRLVKRYVRVLGAPQASPPPQPSKPGPKARQFFVHP